MDYIQALILGIIQGLTEFLPVSSSGHLELGKAILGSVPEENLTFTVILHFATALSTILIFRKDIIKIISGLFQFKNNEEFKFSLKIVLSMIPAALVGVLLEDQIDAMFNGNVFFVGCMLLLTAGLLLLADKAKNTGKKLSEKSAIIIGISQAIAILPGISRSGATISTAVLLGVDKEQSARFSFLMVVPLIFGKIAKDVLGGEISLQSSETVPMLIGFLAAFFTGLLACTWMIKLVKNSKLSYFSIYCLIVGIIAIGVSL